MKKIVIFALVLLAACTGENGAYDASGIFETTEIMVSAEASGRLVEFRLEEGDQLAFDTVLGYVDTTQLHLKKRQLMASVGAVRSRSVDVARQIAALEQQITTAKSERVRFEKLVAANAANQKQLDDINAQIALLQKQLSAQRETIGNANSSVGSEASSLTIQVAQLDDLIAKSIIKSPISGTVLTKYAQQGELVQQGKALFKVADIENMFLRAYVTSSQLNEVKIGQQVAVFGDSGTADRREYRGTVTSISDKAEFTPKTIQTRDQRANLVYAVKIAVRNDGYIKRGMYGEVVFSQK